MLALAIEALVVFLLLFLVAPVPGRKEPNSPSVFSVDAPEKASEEEVDRPDKGRPSEKTARPPSIVPPAVTPPPPVPLAPRGEL
ncbi:MAG: hypothetical protein EOP59_07475, partial [Sphingomonadales bacterium]